MSEQARKINISGVRTAPPVLDTISTIIQIMEDCGQDDDPMSPYNRKEIEINAEDDKEE